MTDWREMVDRSGGPDACWLWTGPIHPDGYSNFYVRGHRNVMVHRLALADALGRPIAPGMWALHTCDVRLCVNPAHLYEGTVADNGRDKAARGRSRNKYTVQTLGRLQPIVPKARPA